ncbi:hypothetical protein [Nonomuraea sp. NPDC046570]|uniref:hypothetical protein n=1 Tax=Nonomuraea sp. NPDC046570 TaxID=3155255 RepID=UPI0033D0DE19
MDSESRAAAGLLAALSRAAARLDELRHPFVRREPFSYFAPSGATTGVHFVLPDGRTVRFAVSVAVSESAFHISGEALVEERSLVELAGKTTASVHEALELLEDYVEEVVSPGRRLLQSLIEEI